MGSTIDRTCEIAILALCGIVAGVGLCRAQQCAGDCNGDGEVTIDELVIGVDIALDVLPLSTCPAFDTGMDGGVSISEVTAAVGNALNGCSSPTGNPTPTPVSVADDSVLEHHHHPNRDGVYLIPELTKAHAATLTIDPTFAPTVSGQTYAQPLYLVDPTGQDVLFVATEQNQVSAFSAATGAALWQRTLAPPIRRSALPCGNIDPLGITGTPVIDPTSRTIFFDAMTDAGGGTARQKIYALSVDDGSTRRGWPIDLNSILSSGGVAFDSQVQNQRPALALLNGRVYVGYGGHAGDCGTYYGWLVGVPIDNPASLGVFRTRDAGVAIWAPGGIASDGAALYATTGNGFGGPEWGDSEAVLRLLPGPVFTQTPQNYFVPANWPQLDASDLDLGGTGPLLVDLPGAVHGQLAIALGKDGKLYAVDRTNLGGIGGALLTMTVASNAIINAAATYHTPRGTYVVFKGNGVNCPNGRSGNVTAVRLLPSEPISAEIAWCAQSGGLGSPMVTQTERDGGDTIVWVVGAEGDEKLHGFDGDDGSEVFGGGTASETMSGGVRRYVTPIAAKGRILVAGDNRVYAFK
jgi:outer membrane protein assembly factor BamB